ncbi:C2 domain [Sesbania bispinosa]|nr:C2 domain [Sesbania bispinosa]
MTITLSPSTTTVVELTVISAEGLHNYTSYFTPTIRPFITLTKLSGPATTTHVSKVDDNPTPRWEDHKFRVPLDPTFFSDTHSSLYLQLFTKRRIVGPAQLGWCLIPGSDIGLLPPGSVQYLSYRLRGRDGSRGHAIVNISIRLLEGKRQGRVNLNAPWMLTSLSPTIDACHTVIGMPVTAIRGTDHSGDFSSTNTRMIR